MLKGLFSKVPYKRDMYIWFVKVSAMMALDAMKKRINPFQVEHYQNLCNQIGTRGEPALTR